MSAKVLTDLVSGRRNRGKCRRFGFLPGGFLGVVNPIIGIAAVVCCLNGPAHADVEASAQPTTVYDQKHYIDVYSNYAVVRSEIWVLNQTQQRQPLALPLRLPEPSYWPRLRRDGGSWQIPQMYLDTMTVNPGITHIEIYYGSLLRDRKGIKQFLLHVLQGYRPRGEVWFRLLDTLTSAAFSVNVARAYTNGKIIYIPLEAQPARTDSIVLQWSVKAGLSTAPHRVSWERHFAQLRSWQPDRRSASSFQPLQPVTIQNHDFYVVGLALVLMVAVIVAWWLLRRRRQTA